MEAPAHLLTASESGGSHPAIGHEPLAVGGSESMQQLHSRRGQAGGSQRHKGLFGSQPRHPRMAGMGLGDHRIARGDRGGNVAAGNGAISQRKISRGEHHHRPQPHCQRADVVLRVDHGGAP